MTARVKTRPALLANVWRVSSDPPDTWAHTPGGGTRGASPPLRCLRRGRGRGDGGPLPGCGPQLGEGVKPWRDLLRRGAKPKAPGHTGQVKPCRKCLPWGEALGPSAPTPRRRDPARRTAAPRPQRTGWAQPSSAGADSLTRTLLQGRGENAEEPPEGRTEARSEWEAGRPAGPEHKAVLGSGRPGQGAPRKPRQRQGPAPPCLHLVRLPPLLPGSTKQSPFWA